MNNSIVRILLVIGAVIFILQHPLLFALGSFVYLLSINTDKEELNTLYKLLLSFVEPVKELSVYVKDKVVESVNNFNLTKEEPIVVDEEKPKVEPQEGVLIKEEQSL